MNSNGPDPGSALLAQAYLSRRVDSATGSDPAWANALEADVQQTYQSLVDADQPLATDLGVLVALLTAAGIPVTPGYLYALAPEGQYGVVEEAISLLKGRMLFDRRADTGRTTGYRTHHETWARRFLEQLLDVLPEDRARTSFGQCVSQLLALADDAQRRDRIERALYRGAPTLHQIEGDPEGWADEIVERIFTLGESHSKLAPLYGETDGERIELPEACSPFVRRKQSFWRAQMYGYQGDVERAKREVERLVDVDGAGTDLTDRDVKQLQFLGHRGLVNYYRLRGEYETAYEHARKSVAMAEETGNVRAEAQARASLVSVEVGFENFDEAREQLESLREFAREHDLPNLEALASQGDARCLLLRGDHDECKRRLQETIELARESNSEHIVSNALRSRSRIATNENDFESAEAMLSEALEITRTRGFSMAQSLIWADFARIARKRGELAVAEDHLERAFEHTYGVDQLQSNQRLALALVECDRGNLTEAGRLAQEAVETASGGASMYGKIEALRAMARIALRQRDLEMAGTYLDRTKEANEQLDNPLQAAACDRLRARLELARDHLDDAARYARQGLERFCESGATDQAADCRRVLGLVAHERENSEAADEHLADGLEKATDSGVPLRIAELHEALARVATDRKNRDRAQAHAKQALSRFEQLSDNERARAVEARIGD